MWQNKKHNDAKTINDEIRRRCGNATNRKYGRYQAFQKRLE